MAVIEHARSPLDGVANPADVVIDVADPMGPHGRYLCSAGGHPTEPPQDSEEETPSLEPRIPIDVLRGESLAEGRRGHPVYALKVEQLPLESRQV
jgi:hypothetical protein